MHPVEDQLRSAGSVPMRFGPTRREPETAAVDARLAENLLVISAELDAPPMSRLERSLRRLRVPDLTVPLVTATPALRRSWFVAVVIAVLFALSATSNQTGVGADRIGVFLGLAPLVPLAGVALAFGRGVDPTHDLVIAAPRDTFGVFLIRALTVLVASSLILLAASALLPAGGAYRVAWLLPALAITTLTMAMTLTTRFVDPRRVAAVLAAAWTLTVVVLAQATSVAATFGPPTQLVSATVAAAAALALFHRRGTVENRVRA